MTAADPRRARTRAALLSAAQQLLAADRTQVSVLEITQAAGVGQGSFYNHFDSKDALFAAAVEDVLELHGALMDRVTEGVDDPAEVFARAFRLTGRLHRVMPAASLVMLHHGARLVRSEQGLAPRARRDLVAGRDAGRFDLDDPDLALAIVAGAVLTLGRLLHDDPDRDAVRSTDEVTVALLRMLGLTADDARAVCARPLPELDEVLSALVR